jgi:predicted transcriptional regulator
MKQARKEKAPKTVKSVRINIRIVEDFLSLQKRLPEIIELYGLKHKYIYETAGIPKVTYFRKLKLKSFDGEEMLRICEAINK